MAPDLVIGHGVSKMSKRGVLDLKGMCHEMKLAFDDMYGWFEALIEDEDIF